MKKLLSLLVISIFVLSFGNLAVAEEDTTAASTTNVAGNADDKPTPIPIKAISKRPALIAKRADIKEDIRDKKEDVADAAGLDVKRCVAKCKEKEDVNCIARCRAADKKEDVRDKKEDIREKRRELLRVKKFEKFKEADKAKLQKLNQKKIQVLQKLDVKKLERVKALDADKLRRIAALGEAKLKKVGNLDEARLRKLAALNKEKIKAYANLKDDQLKIKLDKLKIVKIKKDEKFVKRKIITTKARELNQNYNLAKDRYVKAREMYKDNKAKFNEAKKKIKECEGVDSEECQQLEEDILQRAKEHASGIADTLIESLNKIKNRIEASESLSEEHSAKAIEEIDALIKRLEEIKGKIDAAATKEELREAIKELNQLALKVRKRAKIRAAGLLHDGVVRLIRLAELAGEKADCSIAQLEEKGVDVAELDSKLDEYNAKIEGAKEDFKKAKELLLSGTETAANDAHAKIKEAREKVKEANKFMRELRKDIKDNGGKVCQKVQITVAEEAEVEESVTELITEEVPVETEEKKETKVEVSGDIELPEEAQATLDELVASFENIEDKVELKLKVKKQDNETSVEKDEIEGELTSEQQELWDSLKEQANELVESAEGDDLELEIEIEHEFEAEEEEATEEGTTTETGTAAGETA